jgi:Zn-dependent alcohol dehydrogenase
VDFAFECVGRPEVLEAAFASLGWGGTVVAIGVPRPGTAVSIDVNRLAYVDRVLMGCRYGSARPWHDIPLIVDLYRQGVLRLDELVTEVRPLEGIHEAAAALGSGAAGRVVLQVSEHA